MIRYLFIITAIYCALWGTLKANPRAELATYQKWNAILLDDPVQGLRRIQARLSELLAEQPSRERLELLLVLARSANLVDPSAIPSKQIIEQAFSQARDQSFSDIKLLLAYELKVKELKDGAIGQNEFEASVNKFMREARSLDLVRSHALLLGSEAFRFFYLGEYSKSLMTVRDALRLIQGKVPDQDIHIITLKNDLASALDYLGGKDQSRSLYDEILSAMGSDYRYLRGIVTYNYAAMMKQEDEWSKGVSLYEESIKVLKDINESVISSLARKGLAEILIKQGKATEAHASVDEALKVLSAMNILPDAQADAWRLKAKIYIFETNWASAKMALDAADIELLKNNKTYQSDLSFLYGKTLYELGNTEQAYRQALKSAELLKVQMQEDRQSEIAKLSVQLGLELEKQKNELLVKENQIQAQKIRETEIRSRAFAVTSALSLIVLGLLVAALILLGQVIFNRRHMKLVLDNIEEGLLTIGPKLACNADLSPYMEKLLGVRHELLKNTDILASLLDRSSLDSEQKSLVYSSLRASIGEPALNWDLNRTHLPEELMLDGGDKVLTLHWQVLTTRSGNLSHVLLAIRDATERKKMETSMIAAKKHAETVQLISQELWQSNPSAIKEFLAAIRKSWPLIVAKDHNADRLRMIHTWKGNARLLGLRSLSTAFHELETLWESLDDRQRGFKKVDDWIQVCNEMLRQVSKLSAGDPAKNSPWNILNDVEVNLKYELSQRGLILGGIRFDNQIERWSQELIEVFRVFLIHGVSNSIEHGFVPEETRENLAHVEFHILAYEEKKVFTIQLRDNGSGIDFHKLKHRAEHQGKVFDPDHPTDLLFEDGFSSKDKVSELSGRGVGLSAIKGEVSRLHGRCHIENVHPRGTCLSISIPAEYARSA